LSIRAVMFFADDTAAQCRWWAENLGNQAEPHVEEGVFWWFDLNGVEVCFHPADADKNPVGGSPVVYWSVEDLESKRDKLLGAGCKPHRGPLQVDAHRRICQLVDPFGNVFGLDGR
jgi:predicted enzyme related to lactoylglutathione lyase